jgi:hypothetical protein
MRKKGFTSAARKALKNANRRTDRVSTGFSMHPAPRSSPKSDRLNNDNASGISLEYSLDGSSAMFTHDGSTTLMGQNFAPEDENTSICKSPTKSTNASTNFEDERSVSLSIAASSSTVSIVPSDEELFAIGWGKAMDPNSGAYYYFSLDRSRTVWENPLNLGRPIDAPGSV